MKEITNTILIKDNNYLTFTRGMYGVLISTVTDNPLEASRIQVLNEQELQEAKGFGWKLVDIIIQYKEVNLREIS